MPQREAGKIQSGKNIILILLPLLYFYFFVDFLFPLLFCLNHLHYVLFLHSFCGSKRSQATCAMLGKHSGRHKNYTGFRMQQSVNWLYCRVEIKALDRCKLCHSSMYDAPRVIPVFLRGYYLYMNLNVCTGINQKKAPYELRKCILFAQFSLNLQLYV